MAKLELEEMEEQLPPLEELPELELEPELPEPPPTRASKPRAARSSTPSRGSRSANPRASKSADSKGRALEQIRSGVEDMFVTTGTFCSPFLPVTGTVMIARGPRAADTVVSLCEQDARVMRAMLRFIRYNVYFECATVLGTLAVAVAVDVGQMGPDGFIPSKLIGKEIELVRRESLDRQAAANGAGVPEPEWAAGPAG
jgi:hypothetical protein